MRKLDALFRCTTTLIVCVGFITAHAQQAQSTQQTPPIPGVNPTSEAGDSVTRQMAEKMALQRNSQRQQQLVADAAKLLKLAQDLNANVSKTDKNMLSIPVVKEAEEIEKLAKSIKEKMRDAD